MKFRIVVLRYGHRPKRDDRIDTHICLVARAFGASGIIFINDIDKNIIRKIKDVIRRWGDSFFISVEKSYREVINKWKKSGGLVIHLTMYGININREIIDEIKSLNKKDILVIIGAKKVPRDIYELADYNIAIGNQPHSEIAALAVFLDRFFEGKELYREYKNAKLIIIPQARGKKVIEVG